MNSDIRERIKGLKLTAAMDGPRGPEWLVMRWTPSAPTTPSSLFRYLTQPDLLKLWSPVVPDRPLTLVGPATSREAPGAAPVPADVTSVITDQEVTHRWGQDLIRWRIIAGGTVEADGCRLKIEQELERPEFASMYAAGWQVCLGVLDALLTGQDQERIVGEDALDYGWRELRRAYWASLPRQSDEGL